MCTFFSSVTTMNKWTPIEWFRYCQMMEKSSIINRVFVFPCYCQYRDFTGPYGFICHDPELNSDADLPIKYKYGIGRFSLLVMKYLLKSSLPKEATNIPNLCGNDGYQTLCQIHFRIHPKLIYYPIDVCHAAP